MAMYNLLRWKIRDKDMRDFTRKRLIALIKHLDAELPSKDVENYLLLATWNIRDLGKIERRGYGERLPTRCSISLRLSPASISSRFKR